MANAPLVHDHDSAEGTVPFEGAHARVLASVNLLSPIALPLTEAFGCVVAEDLVAAVDLPEFASSAMDGFAVRASDVVTATPVSPVELKIVGRALIGRHPDATVGAGEAVRIATGAPIPAGADTIVPIENAEASKDTVRMVSGSAAGRHIRPAGEDVRNGQVLVAKGRRLGAPEMGLLANAGHPTPLVHPRPRVVILSTGDELVPPTETPEFGQVHDSNAYTLFAALKEAGAIPVMAGIIKDDVESFKETVFDYLIQADAFISSGGVSVGERDVVKAAFFGRGDVAFYRVAMQPGMPQAFGHIEGKPYVGLPGNPVSVFVSYEVFVRPAVMKMMGRTHTERPQITATLTEDVSGPKAKLQFARVHVERGDQGWRATPTGARGSNLISTVSRANGLAMIPVGVETAPKGSPIRVMVFRASED